MKGNGQRKWIRRIVALLIVLLIAAGAVYLYSRQFLPQYAGEITLKGLSEEVEVLFDDYGIPHIYARNERDAFFALGYLHARERLFQMEMIRRVASGRLAEVFGEEMLEADRFFRTLDLQGYARRSARRYLSADTAAYQQAALAYLAGVNTYIKEGVTPVEFRLAGIPKEPFTPADLYLPLCYTAFNFSWVFRTDPVVEWIRRHRGEAYLQDLALDYEPHWQRIPVYIPESEKPTSKAAILPSGQTAPQASTSFPNSVWERDEMGNSVSPIASAGKPRKTFPESLRKLSSPGKPIPGTASVSGDFPGDLFDRLPIPIWGGSNSWVLGPQHTATGTVIFANDTHMRYSQPSPWFEAYLEYPGFRLYGYFMAGFPFALLGNNGFCAWGMTMCPMDDMDFFVERVNPRDSAQVWAVDHWEPMQVREEIIRIKGKKPDTLQVRLTRHGPVINEVFPFIGEMEPQPVSVWWTLFQFPNRGLEAGYLLNHSRGLADTRRAAALIHAPGVNLMYGDREGNIAWWVAARLIRRPPGVRSKMFLDGASGKEDPRGFYDFSANPRAENPPWGYVFSANNQPDNPDGPLYPGYFAPENRARRIVQLLGRGKKWTVESMKRMSTDVTSAVFPELAQTILAALNTHPVLHRSDLHRQTAEILRRWDGDHQVDDLGPTVFYKLIYHVVHGAMGDELGEEPFRRILRTHLIKKTIPKLLANEQSPWWDDVTTDSLETREEIFAAAFNRTVEELREQLGDDPREWKWGRVHTVEHPHPLGKRKPLDRLFNVGPFSVMGGEEVINPSGFVLTGEGRYRAVYGPATRIILDLGDPEHGVTINPTGESGVVVSPHYDDQAEMYNRGEFRPQLMSREELQSAGARRLVLRP